MRNQESLRQQLVHLDRRGYKAYQDIQGSYDFTDFTLIVDRVQGDPFASPSQLRVQMPQRIAQWPPDLYNTPSREIALRDYLTRQFDRATDRVRSRRGTGNSGLIAVPSLGQEVLERTSAFISDRIVELRFFVGLPAAGRTILGHQAATLLCEDIPQIVNQSLQYAALDAVACRNHVETVEDADWLRQQLGTRGLVAFIADGAVLPRRTGVDDRPLLHDRVAFQSPPSLQVEFNCPNRGRITGMGIPAGITLIVGGGFHGKSTLLRAIEVGIYNHIPGDGREWVVTNPAAVKIRAEEGRSVSGVDISSFIDRLPQGRSTTQFSTENASGSTSQAANIMESLEVGLSQNQSKIRGSHNDSPPVLLVDEDTAATNFMIRDRRMQELIAKEKEPITPFVDRVKSLYQDYGVSTILVMGGSGDYFEVADTVIAMENFQAADVTAQAKAIALAYTTPRISEGGKCFGPIRQRVPLPESLDPSQGRREVRIKVRDVDTIVFGTEEIDLAAVKQIVDRGQLRAIAEAMVYAKQYYMDGQRTLAEILDGVMLDLQTQGLDILSDFPQGDLALFRRFELAAALNRLRTLSVDSHPTKDFPA